jgi:hypothetical protein
MKGIVVVGKSASALRVLSIALIAVFFLAAQAAHVFASTSLCLPRATAPDSYHECGQEHNSGRGGQGRTGCCCGDSSVCGCELNQGRNAGRQDVPVAFGGHLSSHAQIDSGAANSHVACVPDVMGNKPDPRWVEARAPSEIIRLDTTKLLC